MSTSPDRSEEGGQHHGSSTVLEPTGSDPDAYDHSAFDLNGDDHDRDNGSHVDYSGDSDGSGFDDDGAVDTAGPVDADVESAADVDDVWPDDEWPDVPTTTTVEHPAFDSTDVAAHADDIPGSDLDDDDLDPLDGFDALDPSPFTAANERAPGVSSIDDLLHADQRDPEDRDLSERFGIDDLEPVDSAAERFEIPPIVPATVEPHDPDADRSVADRVAERIADRTDTPVGFQPSPVPPPPPIVTPTEPAPATTGFPAPAPQSAVRLGDRAIIATMPRRRASRRRPRVRRVTRILRHVDPWSTFKVAALFSGVAYLVALTSGVLLWQVADRTGALANIERWFTQFGWETFELDGREVFNNSWVIGLFAAIGLTGAIVLLVTVFNLVSDIVGGIRVTVLEEEVVERSSESTKRYVVRSGGLSRSAPPPQGWDVSGDAPVESKPPSVDDQPRQNWSIDGD